jgi:hypothetical protein
MIWFGVLLGVGMFWLWSRRRGGGKDPGIRRSAPVRGPWDG